ncbi:peptide ABC transporter ATP-binding protein [Aureimonas altamirensis]|uniref:Peptide ABC transporter ATP-binding protein n=1 Tax=Aureimonas altamirensis TaxID=370622 RepID=A0A0B1PY93_9HYPH|nr:DMT family transporter [Aureimonas altamirensis]KHJ53069.1 peptide ABC transporter ATP-binding protein [Aureimonas altamirensis]
MIRLVPLFPALFVLIWSTGFIGARYAMPHAEPFTFLAMRFALALCLLLPWVVLARAPWPRTRPALHACIAGSLIHGLYLGGVFYAVRHGLPAGIAALIVGLQPIVTAVMAASFLGERVTPRHWMGLLLGLVGVGLVVVPNLSSDGVYRWQTLVPVIVAAIAISAGTVWQKRFVGGVDLRTGTALQYVGALLPVALMAMATETMAVDWTPELVFALLWLTVVLSIGAILLLLFMIREGAVSRVASLMYLTPGVTAVMAFLLFGESLTAVQLLGLVIAGVGVHAAMRPGRKPV